MIRKAVMAALLQITASRNIPAVSLYKKLGFEIKAESTMKIGGLISHKSHLFLEKKI